ncbi:CCAAT-box-binding transcription factor [Giardia lamblia P15]|uniref:CCAAT-box-binding transcription factor n=1 Tax=Giardia intestinalis (strain P15) TaxID=658858 RepID=E1EY98_GIAIA|nr:CCAAT-box-binding transcription factor [Giardia lamblia P15]
MGSDSYFPSDVVRSTTPWYHWYENYEVQNVATTIPDNDIPSYFEIIYKEVVSHERSLFRQQKYGKRDERWVEATMAKGTFKDRIATMTMYARENPVTSIELLINLEELCKDKKRHAADVLPALIELFDLTLPVNRPLISLERRCLVLKTSGAQYLLPSHKGILASWYFENFLLQYLHRLLVWITDEMGADPQEWMRQKAVETAFELLPYPTTTERCIRYMIDKMGDPVGNVASCSASRLRTAIYLLHSNLSWTVSVVEKESDASRHKFMLYGKDNRIKFLMGCITQSISFLSRSNISQKMLKTIVSFIAFNILPFIQDQSDAEVRLISDLSELFFGLLNRQLAEVCKVEVKNSKIVHMKSKKHKKGSKTRTTEAAQMQEFSVLKYILQGLSTSLKYADLRLIGNLDGHVQTLSAMLRATKYHISMLVATVLLTVAEKAVGSGQSRLVQGLDSQVARTAVNAYYSLINRFEAAHVTYKSRTGLLLNGMGRCMQLTANGIFTSKNIQAAFWKRCLQTGLVAGNGSFVCGAILALGTTMLKLNSYGTSTAGLATNTRSNTNTVMKVMPFTVSYLMSSYKKTGDSGHRSVVRQSFQAQQKKHPESTGETKEKVKEPVVVSSRPTAHLELLLPSKRTETRSVTGEKQRKTVQEIEADTTRRYIPEAYNPATSSAANDELWELLILQNHYHLGVQKTLSLMLTENTFGRYVKSDAGDYDKLDAPAEFSSKAAIDFIDGRTDYCVSKSRYDLARTYPNVCVNGSMYEALATLYNMKGKKQKAASAKRTIDTLDAVTPKDFLTNYKNKADIYTDKQRTDAVNKMTDEERDEYILEAMKQEGLIDSSGRAIDLDKKYAERHKASYIGGEIHNKSDDSSYNLDDASQEFTSHLSYSGQESDGKDEDEEEYEEAEASELDINQLPLTKRERLLMIKKAAGPRGFVSADLVFGDDSSDFEIDNKASSRTTSRKDVGPATGIKLPMQSPETQRIVDYVDSEESSIGRTNKGKELLNDSLLPSTDDDNDEYQEDIPYVTRARVSVATKEQTTSGRRSLQARMQTRTKRLKK